MLHVPRNISFVGKAEYMDSWKTKYLFPAMGMIPIDRRGGEQEPGGARRRRARCCDRGELFGIFPEGTRSRDGDLYKGRTGAARLALKVGCPIFPVGVIGTDEIQPPDAKVPEAAASRARIKIGRPVRPERYASRGAEHLALALDDRRGDVRDPRADRPGVPQRVLRRAPTRSRPRRRRRSASVPTIESPSTSVSSSSMSG